MNIGRRKNAKRDKYLYYYDFGGRGKGQRPSMGLFIYVKPKNAAEKQHNLETKAILDITKSQAILDHQQLEHGIFLNISLRRIFWITMQTMSYC